MLVKSDEKPFNISCDFQDWTLDDPNPGRREFFAFHELLSQTLQIRLLSSWMKLYLLTL